MLRLRIEDFSSLPIEVLHLAAAVGSADLPVLRHRNLVKIFRPGLSSHCRLKITQEKAVHAHYVLRQEAVILKHHRRAVESCQFQRCVQGLAVGAVIVHQQDGVVYHVFIFFFFTFLLHLRFLYPSCCPFLHKVISARHSPQIVSPVIQGDF